MSIFLNFPLMGQTNPFSQPYATYLGTLANERIGYAINPGGDINGDGIDDYLIGTFHYNRDGWDRGAVYVCLGKPTSVGFNVAMDKADARFVGNRAYDGIGYSVYAGDVNGDGYSDILIGAPDGNASRASPGYAYLIFGKPRIDWGVHANIEQVADVRFNGSEPFEGTGLSVAIIPDMNGDGCDEILIGIPFSTTQNRRGKVSLFKGKRSGWSRTLDAHKGDIVFTTVYDRSRLGYWVEEVGDVNGDGIHDFAIGAFGENSYDKRGVYLFFGRRAMDWPTACDVNRADVFLYSEGLGWSVRPAGDVNRDGYHDFIMSDLAYQSGRGIVYLVLGRSIFPSQMGPQSMSASFYGEHPNAGAGFWISRAGDVNADGFDDFLIGSQNYTGPYERCGKAYLIYGKATGWVLNVPLSSIPHTAVGEKDGTIQYGECVAYLGDINGDGGDDFAVSAPYFDSWFGENIGKVYLYTGVPKLQIFGKCRYAGTGAGVPQVRIQTTESGREPIFTTLNGEYTYSVFSKSVSFQLTPFKPMGEGVRDEAIGGYDVGLVLRSIVGLNRLSDDQKTRADVDLDGEVTLQDGIHIARAAVGLRPLTRSQAGTWQFNPPSRSYERITSIMTGEDYTATVLGDVDLSFGKQSAKPTEEPLAWSLEEREGGIAIICEQMHEIDYIGMDLILPFRGETLEGISWEVQPEGSFQWVDHVLGEEYRLCGFWPTPSLEKRLFTLLLRGHLPASFFPITLMYRVDAGPLTPVCLEPSSRHSPPPSGFKFRAYPNPFNTSVCLEISADFREKGLLEIYALTGQRIFSKSFEARSLSDGVVLWNGRNGAGQEVPSGLYLVRIQFPQGAVSMKLLKVQ